MSRDSRRRTRRRTASALTATAASLSLLCAQTASAETVSPLPASDYSVRAACAAPAPGRAGCLALQLVPATPEASAHTHPLGVSRAVLQAAPSPALGNFGMRPADLHSIYQLPSSASSSQTVAIVDAYNDPTAEADLKAYDEEFGLPECTTKNGCFSQVNQRGEAGNLPFPRTTAEREEASHVAREANGWGLEISLDIETVHATCQSCHVLLVEASSPANENLEQALATAERLGAGEISNSYGGLELGESASLEAASAFNHPKTVITASAGDTGYLSSYGEESGYAEFPASSPHVVAVGGTRLTTASKEEGGERRWVSEKVWNGNGAGGGGCSVEFLAPPWQQTVGDWSGVGCANKRAVADVAADADPYTGLAVHYTSSECEDKVEHVTHWCTIGGTSLASPIVASVYALAGGAGNIEYPAQTLYENAKRSVGLHDVTLGSNGVCGSYDRATGIASCSTPEEGASCENKLICVAGAGYDGPTGVGSPNGLAAFKAPAEGELEKSEREKRERETAEREKREREKGSEGPLRTQTEQEVLEIIAKRVGGPSGSGGAGVSSPAPAPPPGPAGPRVVQVSALGFTLKALVALNNSRPKLAQISFAFTASGIAPVRVTLERRVRVHRKTRWEMRRSPLTILAIAGRNSGRLSGRGVLTAGVYRLTLTPTPGAARSLQFQIG